MAPSSPEGLLIGNPRKPWRVGRMLGSGACGTVHYLERDSDTKNSSSSSTSVTYAVKMAPLPPVSKNKKRKKTPAEKNADLLYYESLIYLTHFQRLQGTLIPNTPRMGPSEPPFYGDAEGFRFIVMEKMEAPLMDIVPAVISGSKKHKIAFGDVATSLLHCVQTIHDGKYLFVDVKPDNFMLASGKTPADRIRIIDLGLLRPLKDVTTGGHRTNEEAELIGTPLYASLNVHDGQTLSRRDDLEALGYVISELLIVLIATLAGEKKKNAMNLPWADGISDEDIHEMKKKAMDDPKSSFFSKMAAGGNEEVAKVMQQYFKIVRNLSFKEKPDYDELDSILSNLAVSTSGTGKGARKGAKKVAPFTGNVPEKKIVAIKKGVKGAKKVASATEKDPEKKVVVETATRSTRSSRAAKRRDDFDEDAPSKLRRFDDDDATPFYDACEPSPESIEPAQRPPEPMDIVSDYHTSTENSDEDKMDWVKVSDENHAPPDTTDKARSGVKIFFVDGPQQGESFLLKKGSKDTVVLGSNPKPKTGTSFYLISDDSVGSSHARLVLHASKQLCSVTVTDLKSSSGTFVNGQKVIKGKQRQAFINDIIRLGDSTLQIKVYSAKDDSPKKKKDPTRTLTRTEIVATTKKTNSKKSKPRSLGVNVVCVEGPHKGESFLLEKDTLQNCVLGKNPRVKSGETFEIGQDQKADMSHAKLELFVNKNLCSVKITDLKSTGGTFVNGQMIPKGKNRQAFVNDKIQIGRSVFQIKSSQSTSIL